MLLTQTHYRDVVQLAALWELTSRAAPGAEADAGAEDVTFSAEDIWPAAGSAPAADESAPAPLPPPKPQAEVEAEFRELLEEKGVRTLWVLPPQLCGIVRVRHACSLPSQHSGRCLWEITLCAAYMHCSSQNMPSCLMWFARHVCSRSPAASLEKAVGTSR